MGSIAAGSLRRLLLMNTAYHNIRVIQAPLSCLACRQVQLFTNEHGSQDKMTKYNLNNPATQYSARFQSTAQGSETSVDAMENKLENGGTLMDRILRVLRVVAAPMVKKTVLVGSARNMYNCCVEGMNFEEFFEACELPDTLQSWFSILHLHIWMCLVRLKTEGKDGKFMFKKLVQMMWFDVEERIKNLGTIDSVVTKDTLQALVRQFYGLTIAYDEGLLCDDTVLATVLWRNLFYNKERTDAEQLARLVEYVRKNVQHLDSVSSEQILCDGNITWLPFKEEAKVETESGEDSKEL
ncbi:hypothetical protein ACROYT_G031846 [Oculina patagonica]